MELNLCAEARKEGGTHYKIALATWESLGCHGAGGAQSTAIDTRGHCWKTCCCLPGWGGESGEVTAVCRELKYAKIHDEDEHGGTGGLQPGIHELEGKLPVSEGWESSRLSTKGQPAPLASTASEDPLAG